MDASKIEANVEVFLQGLRAGTESLRRVMETYNEKVAFDFNSVRFFQPDENRLSRILAFFLDPRANHGQGSTFLNLFVEQLVFGDEANGSTGCSSPNATGLHDGIKAGEVKVRCEDHTDENRRVDIVIEIGHNDFVIGIENKIWSADQFNQVSDYCRWLGEKKSKNGFVLFYLSPYGHEPSENSIEDKAKRELQDKGQLKVISYCDDIIPLFERFEQASKADNVRAFLRDFQHYLHQRFRGERFMDEQKFVADYVLKNRDNVSTAMDIICAADGIRSGLLRRLRVHLDDWARDWNREHPEHELALAYVVDNMGDLRKTWSVIIRIDVVGWEKHDLQVQSDAPRGGGTNLIFGIRRKDQVKGRLVEADFPVPAVGEGYRESDWWLRYAPLPADYRDWLSNWDAWREMNKETYKSNELVTWLRGETSKLMGAVATIGQSL